MVGVRICFYNSIEVVFRRFRWGVRVNVLRKILRLEDQIIRVIKKPARDMCGGVEERIIDNIVSRVFCIIALCEPLFAKKGDWNNVLTFNSARRAEAAACIRLLLSANMGQTGGVPFTG